MNDDPPELSHNWQSQTKRRLRGTLSIRPRKDGEPANDRDDGKPAA